MKKFSINPDIKKAQTLPADFYRSQAHFDTVKEAIFFKILEFWY